LNRLVRSIQRTRLIPIVTFTTFIFISCAHKGDWAERIAWEEIDIENIPEEEQYPDAGAIILLDEGKMEIFGGGQIGLSLFERHRIAKIFNTRGQKLVNVVIPYDSQTEVKDIQARTISPEGNITVLDDKTIYDITHYPKFIFYSDQRAKLFTMPAVENGSLIEYRYRLNIRNRTFWHFWSFQDDFPTLLSRFTLIEPSEWEVNYQLYNIDLDPHITKNPQGFKSTYVWEARNVSAYRTEFAMPPFRESLARLAVAPVGFKTWQDVAKWYYDLSEPQIKPSSGVKRLAATLTEGVENDKGKLQRIYEWVRDHIRYVAVEIGIGGYQPHPAEEILVNHYGDCKDMTTLLCSLAREAGIDTYEVMVSTRQNGIQDTSLPSQLQFNHAIAYSPTVGDDGVWMDATEKGCPFGQLPWYDQGLPVLVVGKEGKANIITTPSVPPDSNRTTLDWRVDLESSGSASVIGETLLRGAYATELREELLYTSPDAHRQWLEMFLANRCSGAKLDSFRISGLHPVQDPLTISYTFRTATFAVSRTREMVFRPGSILAFDLPDYFRSPKRVHPIRFLFGSRRELHLTVNLPGGWTVDTPAFSDSLASPFGSALWSWTTRDNVLHVHLCTRMMGDDVKPQHYQGFQDFLDRIRKGDLREVVITEVHKLEKSSSK